MKILINCFGKAWLEHFRHMQAQTVCTPPADLCRQKGVENPTDLQQLTTISANISSHSPVQKDPTLLVSND